MENEADAIILPRTEDLVFWLFWLVSVIFLLSWDLRKAWKRGAPWIPGQALVLSAIIIELLSFIDYSHISVYSGSRYQTKEVVATLVKNHLVIDTGRLMMCVLIAYLLPGMARSGSIMDGSNLAVLALSIASQVFSELRSFWSEGSERIISDVCSTILILAIIYLLVLLIRAVMSGRTICRIGSQKISSALSSFRTPCDRPSYNDVKNHVLQCWIVARFSQPDYVLVRTGLCSMAFPVVTVCIGVQVIHRTYVQFTDNESLNSGTKTRLVQFVIAGQCVIVLIGWIVLLVRWVTSHMQGHTFRRDYLYSMSIEDALTDLTADFIRLFVRDKRIQEKTIREMKKKIRDINSLLWYPWHWVQKLFQIFSMQNPPRWLTSTKWRLSRIKTRVIESVSIAVLDEGEFDMYEKTLNMLLIPGESARSLWKANQWGFRKVERYMEPDQEDGKCSRSELTDLLRLAEGEADREKAERLQQANKNSWKRTAVSLIHFMIYSYNGSDASAIEDASVIEKAMQCYIQGWEYMNFVDGLDEKLESLGRESDNEYEDASTDENEDASTDENEDAPATEDAPAPAIEDAPATEDAPAPAIEDAPATEDAPAPAIEDAPAPAIEDAPVVDVLNEEVKSLGRQADEEFDSLQHNWNKRAQHLLLEREIKWPLRHQLESRSNEQPRYLQNSRDSTEVAEYCLFETWTVIDPMLPEINKIDWLQRELADVYFFCMTEYLNKAVLQKCSKLAEEGMEEEILDVAFLAAKAQRVLDKVAGGNDQAEHPHNSDQGSISSSSESEIELVGGGPGGPTGQASTSSHIPTVGQGNGQADQGSIRPRYRNITELDF